MKTVEELKKFHINISNKEYLQELNLFFKERENDHISFFFREKMREFTRKTTLPVSLRSKIFWKIRGFTEEQAKEKIKDIQNTTSSEKIIQRELSKGHSNEEALQILRSYRERQGKWISDTYRRIEKENPEQVRKTSRFFKEYWINKGFSEEEAIKLAWEESRKCRKKFHEMLNEGKIERGWSNTQIEYYIKKGVTLEEAAELLAERQNTFSLKKCILKYGEEQGINIWNKRQEKWIKKWKDAYYKGLFSTTPKTISSSRFSKNSIDLFKELNFIFLEAKFGINEWFLRNSEGIFFFDFMYNNKIIEFHGDYWHCNPVTYKEDYFHPQRKMYAKDIWEFDRKKTQMAKEKGYDYMFIWESQYKQNREYIINLCKNFLNGISE